MKNLRVLLFSIITLSVTLQSCRKPTAAEPELINIVWEKTYGGAWADYGRAVRQTSDGGYIIAGNTLPYTEPKMAYFIKTDAHGNIQWEKAFGGEREKEASCICETNDGGFMAVGRIWTSTIGYIYFIRMNSAGDTLWTKAHEGFGAIEPYSLIKVADENLIITGSIGGCVGLMKFDGNANHIWTLTYLDDNRTYGTSVALSLDDRYIIVGVECTSQTNGIIVKTDANGQQIWLKRFCGPNGKTVFHDVLPTTDGCYIVTGLVLSELASNEAYLLKVDSLGDSVWAHTYGGHDEDELYSLQQTAFGGYLTTGITCSSGNGFKDIYILLTDENGDSLSSLTHGGANADFGMDIEKTNDGDYVIVGYGYSFGEEASNIYLLKVSFW